MWVLRWESSTLTGDTEDVINLEAAIGPASTNGRPSCGRLATPHRGGILALLPSPHHGSLSPAEHLVLTRQYLCQGIITPSELLPLGTSANTEGLTNYGVLKSFLIPFLPPYPFMPS